MNQNDKYLSWLIANQPFVANNFISIPNRSIKTSMKFLDIKVLYLYNYYNNLRLGIDII